MDACGYIHSPGPLRVRHCGTGPRADRQALPFQASGERGHRPSTRPEGHRQRRDTHWRFWGRSGLMGPHQQPPCRPSGVANSPACAGVPSFPWALATPLAGMCAAAATPETRHCQRRDEVPVRACSRENGQRERRRLSSAGELQGGGVCV